MKKELKSCSSATFNAGTAENIAKTNFINKKTKSAEDETSAARMGEANNHFGLLFYACETLKHCLLSQFVSLHFCTEK